jgi:VIT1/CCC1 family predicted Fe2+/Mn2+ transporter
MDKYKKKIGYHLSNIIYGANDGIITTFAVISGSAGAGFSSKIIIVLGIANLIADGFSMGASRYLSLKSEQDYKHISNDKNARKPSFDGFVTFIAFVLAGFLPLIPFLFDIDPERQFIVSAISTSAAFFFVGSSRNLLTGKGFFISGMEMLAIGGVAASIAYGIGHVISLFVV